MIGLMIILIPLLYMLYLFIRVTITYFYYRTKVKNIKLKTYLRIYQTIKNFNDDPIAIIFEKRNYPLKNRKIRKVI